MSVHSTLTGADLHEPKGVAAASADKVYVSDGAGSGSWTNVGAVDVTVADADGVFTGTNVETVLGELYDSPELVTSTFLDISNAETVLLPVAYSCVIESVSVTLLNAITVANAVVTLTRSDGASLGSTLTITQAGSAEGSTFDYTPTTNEELTYPTHKYIKLVSDGGSTTACRAFVQMKIRRGT